MNYSKWLSQKSGKQGMRRRGAMLILVLLCLLIVFVGAALSIDVAHMHVARAELRTATDAAARAGAAALGRGESIQNATRAAIDVASQNKVAGQPLVLKASDIDWGQNQRKGVRRFRFKANVFPPNTIRVRGHRTQNSPDGPVPLFFGPLFDVSSFQPVMKSTASSTSRDIALVLDVSGSMNWYSGRGTRLKAMIRAVNIFIDEIEEHSPNAQISLTTYAYQAKKVIRLTDDLNAVRRAVRRLRAFGATAIGEGLLMGSNSLKFDPAARTFASKSIVVMTDGHHNWGVSPEQTVETAVRRNHTVHTITFSSAANKKLMKKIARRGGGIHVHADNNQQLEEGFREIAGTIAVKLIQ
ncbi:MAG: VWA domain-containing protein [Pirellulaceae bacterium]|nr:VWA domain-containing protein [Pirellulaceae bacterium]